MANVAKLEEVLDYIRTHPDEHNQDTWGVKTDCGTTMCFAGTAVHLSSEYTLTWRDGSHIGKGWEFVRGALKGGLVFSISDTAAEILGLTDEERCALFYTADNLDDLEVMVKNIANGDLVCDGIEDED